jgi:hypothetical protein
MRAVLEEIQTIPGVTGGFLYHPRKGILESDLPAVFKEPKLLKIGRILVKIYATGRANFSDISEITLFYEESLVLIRELRDAVHLIILGSPDLNMNLLTMTLNLMMEDLDLHFNAPPDAHLPKTESDPMSMAGTLLERGPMAQALSAMQRELSKVVGPMSKIIFTDALRRWIDTGTPSPGTYSVLMKILADEIDDPEKMRYYRQLITPHLEPREPNAAGKEGGRRYNGES